MNDPLFTPFEPSPSPSPSPSVAVRRRSSPSVAPDKPAAAETPKRKPRSVSNVRTPVNLSVPVSTVLAAVKDLHGDDTTLFEKLLGILAAAGKGQRERVIAALGKVFS